MAAVSVLSAAATAQCFEQNLGILASFTGGAFDPQEPGSGPVTTTRARSAATRSPTPPGTESRTTPGSGVVNPSSLQFQPNMSTGAVKYVWVTMEQIPGGLDLTFLGAPGCNAYVTTLDLTQAMVGLTPTNSVSLQLPPLLPVGTQIYSQTAGLIQPFSLPNGQNAFGLTVSNGLRSFISSF